jgi:3-oxoacyl-[acyl-carrier protein] reductase
VLITGAGRGIGAAVARAFAAQGATVCINYLRSEATAEHVVDDCRRAGGDAIALRADVRSPEAVAQLVAAAIGDLGRIDVLVNNAFSPYAFDPMQRKRFSELAWVDYQSQFDGAVGAAFNLCQAVLPHFRQRARGAIVNIVSDLVENPLVPYHDYTTGKAALIGFSRNLASELGPLGVRVNCVAPGLVYPTQGSTRSRAGFRDAIAAATPLRRIARPEDIAGPVLFLASDWSGFVTGQVLFVNGGLAMK